MNTTCYDFVHYSYNDYAIKILGEIKRLGQWPLDTNLSKQHICFPNGPWIFSWLNLTRLL